MRDDVKARLVMPAWLAVAAVTAAIAAPTLLAYNVPPSVTVLNQLLAALLWGGVLTLVATDPRRLSAALWSPLTGALLATALGVSISASNSLPPSIAASSWAFVGLATLVAWHGHAVDEGSAYPTLACAVFLAGIASAAIALVQVFAPHWPDGDLLARSGLPGRAVGNLRQPNHLSSLLLWGLIAWVPLAHAKQIANWRFDRWLALPLGLLLLWGIVLTASRTGTVGVVLLALWGLVDRRLDRWVRASLVAAPLVYLLIAFGMSGWAHASGHTFGGEGRLAERDVSASRFGIWSNTLELIGQQPWAGVGFGEFNFAWTLMPFPGRPVAFFDHTHNLVLQLWVEFGVPLGTLVLALLMWALVLAGMRSWRVTGHQGAGARSAFMTVLMIGVHSLFEYPLWYAYFLLPTAWAWGYALRTPETAPDAVNRRTPAPSRIKPSHLLQAAGALTLAGSLFALHDYWKVVAIYAPTDDAGPLAERIERGQTSFFFAHHADYAAATTADPPSSAMGAFNTTTHSLLDTRLMLAWANALNESGHRDKASYLAARLREFRNPAATDFFAACDDPGRMNASPPPFQCVAPPPGLTWRDFQARGE